MTAVNKKINKILNKAYSTIIKIIIEELSKKYNIPVDELEKTLNETSDD